MPKPDCHECKWRGTLPGSAHSKCCHPSLDGAGDDPFAGIFGIIIDEEAAKRVIIAAIGLRISANAAGIRKGWFNWPFNFDPVWLENCMGFEEESDG